MLGLLGGSRQHCQMCERLDRHNDGSAHDHVPVVAVNGAAARSSGCRTPKTERGNKKSQALVTPSTLRP
jgi:hypothetical protein